MYRGKLILGAASTTLAFALVATWWFRPSARPPPTDQYPVIPVIEAVPPAVQLSSPAIQARTQLPGGPPVPLDPRWKVREVRKSTEPDYEWKSRIDFYGRVFDEREQPVGGARVEAEWSDLSERGASKAETLSDPDGYFAITGKTGRGITIRLSKPGYYTPKNQQTSFDYAAFWEGNYHEPNAKRPVLFHLRKRGEGVVVLGGEIRTTIPANGTPVCFDLLDNGRVSGNGQLEVAAVTNTERYPPNVFDWSATIAVRGGGLVEHDLEFPFEAPEAGYKESIQFDMPASASPWKRVVERAFFVQFGEPRRYGRFVIRMNGGSQSISIDYVINATGNRLLEPTSKRPSESR